MPCDAVPCSRPGGHVVWLCFAVFRSLARLRLHGRPLCLICSFRRSFSAWLAVVVSLFAASPVLFWGVKKVSSLDVSTVVVFVADVVIPVTAVGFALLMVRSTLRAMGFLRDAVGDPYETFEISSKEDRKSAEFNAAASDHGGVASMTAHMDKVEASYSQMWAEQAATRVGLDASTVSVPGPSDDAAMAYDSFTREEKELVQKLQANGNSFDQSVSKVEARADAITRSVLRARGE